MVNLQTRRSSAGMLLQPQQPGTRFPQRDPVDNRLIEKPTQPLSHHLQHDNHSYGVSSGVPQHQNLKILHGALTFGTFVYFNTCSHFNSYLPLVGLGLHHICSLFLLPVHFKFNVIISSYLSVQIVADFSNLDLNILFPLCMFDLLPIRVLLMVYI